jgi:hypothetical protein
MFINFVRVGDISFIILYVLTFTFLFCRIAFCLLPNKRGRTYTELFERLKDEASIMGKQFNPKRIITDYEPGLLPVVEQEVSFFTLIIHFPSI